MEILGDYYCVAAERFRRRMTDPLDGRPIHGTDRVIEWALHTVQKTVIKRMPEFQVIYYRHRGALPDRTSHVVAKRFAELRRGASLLRLPLRNAKMMALSYDDPHITDMSKCRVEACMSVEGNLPRLPQHIGSQTIPAGNYAFLSIAEIPAVASLLWELAVQEWLPQNGCYPDFERPAMEVYAHSPMQDPYGRQVFDLYIPIRTHVYL